MLRKKCFLLLVAAALSTGQLAATNYTFTTISGPDGLSGGAFGINNAGEVVGNVSPGSASDQFSRAYVYQNGTFEYIDAVGSGAMSINNLGEVVGWDKTGSFLYDGTQLTSLYPLIYRPVAINDNDQILGVSPTAFPTALIDLDTGTVEQTFHGCIIPCNWDGSIVPTGINNAGEIVGTDVSTGSAFLYKDGAYTVLTPYKGSTVISSPVGINNKGQIVGTFLNPENPDPGFEGRMWGFVYANGSFEYVFVDNSIATMINGINDNGQIVGSYLDSNHQLYGFLGTPIVDPIPEPASVALVGGGLVGLALLKRKRVSKLEGPIHEESAPIVK